MINHPLTLAIATGLAASTAAADVIPDRATLDGILGGNQILEDFESFDIVSGDATTLDTLTLNSTTIANGQGPGLVEAGATYSANFNGLQWNGDTYFGLDTRTLLANGSDGTITIDYDAPMLAVGLDVLGFESFGWSGTASFLDSNAVLLGTIDLAIINGGSERVFAGWTDAGGIGQVVIASPNYGWSPIIDDHGYGVPTPGTAALLGLGGLVAARRRRC